MSLTPENGDRGCAKVSVGHYSAHFFVIVVYMPAEIRRERGWE